MSAVQTRAQYLALFGSTQEAVAFENEIQQAGREHLPQCAIAARSTDSPPAEYWQFLADQLTIVQAEAGKTLDVDVVAPPLTAATITEAQIRKLRDNAGAHGDDRQVDYCDVALAPYRFANDDGSVLVWPWNGQDADRTEARKVCADAINAARAADDSEIGGES